MSLSKLYLEKSENELILAESLMKISEENNLKSLLKINKNQTFYTGVISHSYYSIFYAAKAYLINKNIKTKLPNEHKKTYEKFKRFVRSQKLSKEIIKIYEKEIIKADSLLHIFKTEKRKRGKFVYKKLPEANKSPAQESIENAQRFFKIIHSLLEPYM